MPGRFFNLNNPFERKVSERLDKYLKQGLPHDMVQDMIGRDFPYMDSDARDHCENTAFIHHVTGADGKAAATFKRVALVHSKFKDEPFYSHLGQKFHLKEGEDLFLAVLVENPLYLYEKANVHLTFYIDDRQVNEFSHTMVLKERRNVYYVPLNILGNVKLPNESHTSVKIDVVDENIKGSIYSIEPDIYYGETDPADVFTLHDVSIYDDYTGAEGDVFVLGRIESVHLSVCQLYGSLRFYR